MKNFLLLFVTLIIAINLEKCFPKYLLVKLDDAGEKGEFALFHLFNPKMRNYILLKICSKALHISFYIQEMCSDQTIP